MRVVKLELLIVCIVVGCLVAAGTVYADPHFRISKAEEWDESLAGTNPNVHVRPMDQAEWSDYITQFNDNLVEGDPYPNTTFVPPELYVYECNSVGGGGGAGGCGDDPPTSGLVMAWGDPCTMVEGQDYASAWVLEYGEDPDLSNSTVTVQVEPPCGINTISIGVRDGGLLIRSWTWNVAAAGAVPPLPVGTLQCSPDAAGLPVRHTISINLAQTGVAAATPTAAAYANTPGFNIKNVLAFVFDENATWVAASSVPPPGQTDPKPWNYWFNLVVTPNIGGGGTPNSKWFIKWSQPPKVIDSNEPPVIWGWDELSDYNNMPNPIMADDWLCEDRRPVTDIHWWGSFIGWNQPNPPPIVPKAFHIGIWTDVPDDPNDSNDFSHPGTLIWENYCECYVWNFAGYDKDPFYRPERENETCFQYAQFLSQDEWFYQEPSSETQGTVYWLSIAAVYNPTDYTDPNFYPWGWKTRPHHFMDDATSITALADGSWPPKIGSQWAQGTPLKGPDGETWDLAFELTTNIPPKPSADLNFDGWVDFRDFATFADQWLTTGP